MRFINLSMSFGVQDLFKDINLYVPSNEKVGIIGVNGAGKTTLFKIILGIDEPTSGKIVFEHNERIGYLPQVIDDEIPAANITVYEFLLSARPIEELNKELENTYLKLIDDPNSKALANKIEKIQKKLDYWDSYSCESILMRIVKGMGISDDLLLQDLNTLSGGQKSKVAFARLLYTKPEILLLDEPTNHLDPDTRNFIIDYLKNYNGSVLVISHDIDFLDSITNVTLFLDKVAHSMELYPGNYAKYKRIKAEKEKSAVSLLEKQTKEEEKLKKIIAKYIRGNEKKANIAKDRIKKLEKLQKEKVVINPKQKVAHLKLKINNPSGMIPLKVTDLSFGYNQDKMIINNLTFELTRGEKFLIMGENGVGKSTLLKLIMKEYKQNSGEIVIGNKTEIGYYAQEHELLDNDKTILDNFKSQDISQNEIRSVLGNFLFFGTDVNKMVNVLSPGEKARVALAKLSILGANLLILDEPTNHLDPETQKIIAQTFKTYPGTMIIVSHNPEFVDYLGIERVLLLPSGKITYYNKELANKYYRLNAKEK